MKSNDDFDWTKYTKDSYLCEIDKMEKDNYDFKVNKSYVENDKLIVKDNLHPNWIAIYSTIIEQKVSSVFECGCGGCYHLFNLNKLLPNIEIAGCDISENQINIAGKSLNIPDNIIKLTKICDFSQEIKFDIKYEFVFTQAVIMHLSNNKALQFIKNMKNLSSKYIMMVENQGEHDFEKLLNESSILNEFDLIDNAYKGVNGMFLIKKELNVKLD